MKLLSIIVPMYNMSKYLASCLDSLVNQNIDKAEYEIILIDDGSTDNTLDIAKEYASKYDNIKVITKENGGVSSARNLGIDISEGEYIWFVDSDDFISSNCLAFIKRIIIENTPEFISMAYKKVNEDYNDVSSSVPSLSFKIFNNVRLTSATVCATILKADIIKHHNIRFNEKIKYGEDSLFQYYVFLFRNGSLPSIHINNSLYYYRQRGDSSLNTKSRESYTRHAQDYIALARIYQNDYNSRIVDDKEMLEYIKRSQYLATQGALTILPKSNLPYKQTMKMLRKEGFYPYPMQSQKLKTAKGIKQKLKYFIISLLKFRFFYGLYYFFTRRKK